MKYPIGIQSFSEIRNGGYVYVDKTALIHRLVTEGKYYFLSRPRRFGKSLLLSTIESLFLGQRQLFEGLAVDSLDWDWQVHPVFHIDLNVANYGRDGAVVSRLNETLGRYELMYGLDGRDVSQEMRFERLIMKAYETTGQQVVILIDEYDKPLVDTMLEDDGVLDQNRMILQAFYGVMKSLDRYIRFAMLTGVTKFGKVSVFSGLNNLTDISLEAGYNDICGITEMEIDRYFRDSVAEFGRSNSVGYDEAVGMLKDSYDGYHFSRSGCDVYNPFSLLNALRTGDLGSYWFESGTPTFLVRLLQSQRYVLPDLENVARSETSLKSSDVYTKDLVPIFYQTGYLSIKGYNPLLRSYTLDYPNREVKQGFLEFLVPYYSPSVHSSGDISDMVSAVLNGDADSVGS